LVLAAAVPGGAVVLDPAGKPTARLVTEMHVDGFRFDLAVALAGSFMRWAGYRRSTWYSKTRCVQVKVIAKPGMSAKVGTRGAKISRAL